MTDNPPDTRIPERAWRDIAAQIAGQTTLPEDFLIHATQTALAADHPAAMMTMAPWVGRLDHIPSKIALCDGLRKHGLACQNQGDFTAALHIWQAIIDIAPRQPEIWREIATCFRRQERWQDERYALEKALEGLPEDPWLLIFYGYVLERFHDYDGAYAAHQKAFSLHPDHPDVLSACEHSARRALDWDRVAQILPMLEQYHKPNQTPFEGTLQIIYRYPDDHKVNPILSGWARFYDQARNGSAINPPLRDPDPDRIIRIGYLSGDFHDHPVMHLLGGLFAAHDRQSVHVTALSIGPAGDNPYRRIVMRDADQFIDLQGLGDERLARAIAEQQIDILVDLKGMTAPLGVLAWRPAPIIASWLGFPGSTGANYVDYLIADHFVTPDNVIDCYPEAIARLPVCYLPNDDQQAKNPPMSRADAFGADHEHKFIFGGWCHTGKMTRDVFSAWLAIVRAVPHGVLVLRQPHDSARHRLIKVTEQNGIDPARLLFLPMCDKADHFARMAAMDLFLDTWPYGSHSTGCDALWAGLPMLTRKGTHFASRVGESLLRAVGLPELIAETTDDYVAKAITLAHEPAAMRHIRDHLRHPETLPLFQTRARTRDLENLYREMWQRACAGLPAENINNEHSL